MFQEKIYLNLHFIITLLTGKVYLSANATENSFWLVCAVAECAAVRVAKGNESNCEHPFPKLNK